MTDIDPALDAHLRRTLREVAATVDADPDAEPNVVRLVPTTPPARPRHWRWIAAAAVAGLASGAALMAVANRDDEPAGSATEPLSTESAGPPPSDAPLTADEVDAVVACEELLHESGITTGAPLLESELTRIVVIDAPIAGYVVFISDPMFRYACRPGGLLFTGPVEASSSLADPLVVESLGGEGESSGLDRGPGTELIVGRADASVSALRMTLSDGTIEQALIGDGWFVFNFEFGSDVAPPSGSTRITWTLDDGTTASTRLDLIDTPSDEEVCAALAGCIDERVSQLTAQAATSGSAAEIEALADGVVTSEELIAAKQAWVDCLAESGMSIELGDTGVGYVMNPGSLEPAEQQQAYARCQAVYPERLDTVWYLLDAAERVAAG